MLFVLLQAVADGLVSHLMFESCSAKEISSEHVHKVSILLLAIINKTCKVFEFS
jgi:hypothetical protein